MTWQTVKLADVCDVRDGTHDSPKYVENGFPLITSKNLVSGFIDKSNASYISEADYKNICKRSQVDFGDILMPMIGTIGNPVIVDEASPEFAIKNVALIKFGNNSPDRFYIKSLLQSQLFNSYTQQVSRGGTQKFLSLGDIRKFSFPLPPLPEQKRIAAILDKADEIRRKREAAMTKLDQLAQSIFVEMFGDPLTNEKSWKIGASILHCECIVPGRDKPKKFSGDIPWVTTNDLNRLTYTDKSKNNIGLTVEEVAEVRAKIIPEKSVILTCVGDLGVISINSSPVVINQQLHSFQCDNLNILPIFMMYVLSHQTPYMYKMASSTTVPYMNKTVCNNIPMIYPPLTLQKQFANKINKLEQLKSKNIAALTKQNQLFTTLQHQAFTGAL